MMPRGFSKSLKIAPLIPRAAGGPRHGGDDGHRGILPHPLLISATSEVTMLHRQSRKAFISPSVRVSASQKASAMSAGKSKSLAR